MSARRAPDRHLAEGKRQDLAVEEAHHRIYWPHPAQRRGRKAHCLRPRHVHERRVDQIGQHLGRRRGRGGRFLRNRIRRGRCRESRNPRLRRAPTERRKPSIAACGAPTRGPRRSSRWRGSRSGIPSAIDREPPWRDIAADRLHWGDAMYLQPLTQMLDKLLDAAALHPRRDLFAIRARAAVRSRQSTERRAGEPGFAARVGERPDAQDIGGALGHADAPRASSRLKRWLAFRHWS